MGVIKEIGSSVELDFFEKIRVESKIFKIRLDLGLIYLRPIMSQFLYSNTNLSLRFLIPKAQPLICQCLEFIDRSLRGIDIGEG